MSELSVISIEKPAVGCSPTDNTMIVGVKEKAATSFLFSESDTKCFGKFLSVYYGNGNWR